MSGTPFTPGQLGKLQTIVNTAATTALPQIAAQFRDPKAVLEALKNKTSVLAEHLEELVAQAIRRMMVLVRRGRASLTTSARYDSASLQTRKGLWVYDGYTKLVASKAKPVEGGTTFDFDIHEIGQPQGAADAEIEGALPKEHFFDETAINAIIAEAVAKQPNGEPGKFPTDRVILLYTDSCVVDFYWYAVDAEWLVGTWYRDVHRWHAGVWVLSPAN